MLASYAGRQDGKSPMGQDTQERMMAIVSQELLDRLSVELADQGRLIEAGFIGLRKAAMAPDAPEDQVREMRWAFMAGAQHLFASIMSVLEPGDDEPTEKDLARMDLISKELENFYQELTTRYTPTKGSA